jgi:hypothetical protein
MDWKIYKIVLYIPSIQGSCELSTAKDVVVIYFHASLKDFSVGTEESNKSFN